MDFVVMWHGDVPDDFWKRCIAELKKTEERYFHAGRSVISLLYTLMALMLLMHGVCFHMMKKVAKGERAAIALDSVRNYVDTAFPSE